MNQTNLSQPTPFSELNAVLQEFVAGVQALLGEQFMAAYLNGSLALGAADEHSDVDFLIVTARELGDAELSAIEALHQRIYALESNWAKHLEGSYIPQALLLHADPSYQTIPYLDNGHQTLERSNHCNNLVMRWMTREHGIVLAGPPPATLIAPVVPNELRQEVWADMQDWAREIFAAPERMHNRWYQPFAVLSYCRMLQTLHTGMVHSKAAGARWATHALHPHWTDLIERAWQERPNPSLKARQPADQTECDRTLAFIHYAIDTGRQLMERGVLSAS